MEKAKGLMETFPLAAFEVIPRSKNVNTNALAKLALIRDAILLDTGVSSRT